MRSRPPTGDFTETNEQGEVKYKSDALVFDFARSYSLVPADERQARLNERLQSEAPSLRDRIKLQCAALLMATLDSEMVTAFLDANFASNRSYLSQEFGFDDKLVEMFAARVPHLHGCLKGQGASLAVWAVLLTSIAWSDEAAVKASRLVVAVVKSTGRDAVRVLQSQWQHTPLSTPGGILSMVTLFTDPCLREDTLRSLLATGAFTEEGRIHASSRVDGNIALCVSGVESPPEVMRLLLDAGVDPSCGSEINGEITTPLHAVGVPGEAEKVRMLIAAGANLELCDSKGFTPLVSSIASITPSVGVFDALIAAGADPSALRYTTRSPVHPLIVAGARGDVEAARRLLDTSLVPRGTIDIDARDPRDAGGMCALDRACVIDSHRIVRMLIDAGARVTKSPPGRHSPLEIACIYGSYKSAKILIKSGALSPEEAHSKAAISLMLTSARADPGACSEIASDISVFSYGLVTRTAEDIRAGWDKIIALLEGCD